MICGTYHYHTDWRVHEQRGVELLKHHVEYAGRFVRPAGILDLEAAGHIQTIFLVEVRQINRQHRRSIHGFQIGISLLQVTFDLIWCTELS